MNYHAKYYKCPAVQDIHTTREVRLRAVEKFGDKLAFRQIEATGVEKAISFRTFSSDVDSLGTAMLMYKWKGKHIALLCETSIEMVEVYVAVSEAVGVIVPIDRELDPQTIAYQLQFADVEILFCSDRCLKKWKKVMEYPNGVKKVVVMRMGASVKLPNESYLRLESMLEEGKSALIMGNRDYVEAVLDSRKFCMLVYTSGTTGANKGVMLCMDNIWTCLFGARHIVNLPPINMSLLPASHTYEMSCNILSSLYEGCTVCINDDLKHVMTNLKHFSPQMTCMVPMMVDAMVRSIKKEVEISGRSSHINHMITLSNLVRKIGIDTRRLFFFPILDRLDGNLQKIFVGGAPMSQEKVDFMESIGIDILIGYGITECSPLVACNGDRLHRKGSVGHVLPTNQVRITNRNENGIGEIEVKGNNVMLGYYKMPKETADAFTDDGWFKTGDLGYLDKDDFLYLTGRRKNLIILANGKNISPEEIEERLQNDIEYIKECVVFADEKNNGISAICYLDPAYCAGHQLTDEEKMYKHLMTDVDKFNRNSPTFKRLTDVQISPHQFEKTSTKKIKRELVTW